MSWLRGQNITIGTPIPIEWTWTNQKMRSWFAKHAL
jgi:hypothetical protein